MKKIISIFVLFFLINSIAFAQKKDSVKYNPYSGSQQPKKTSILDDFYFGGNLYFTFGSYTSIGIWPSAGYKITPKLSVGIQPGYEYLKYDNYYGGTYESSNYGVRFFSRFRVIPQAYLHAEYATINYGFQSQNANGDIVESRDWVPFLFLGAGVSQSIGGRTFMYAQILFDVINDENSPYRNGEPFLSIGVVAGF